ncbi:tol-pal system-associated acyl-CoA thioesterase [Beijerinckia indica]|uniref:Tol-pal system-associated acyl-CoA thioesterase n=1 Tax=Beijerinckia indica subsp. indica (strain ATCC 9039 / DSM 1715 / NCIMB 8712) TaxID=395963 RepID=B2ID74_BEII9|nr:tol-pal system-associated acyl-CoA thioesterase [Beijerinckia indica]ACB93931.1 tol-pal system-associated acyl-CoA thioesterase [Beijerinckia indica subsp. indica ATCC 9039]
MESPESVVPHCLGIRVYYEDTDFSGIVYHASYLRFMERGRTEFLRERGISQGLLAMRSEGEAFAFVVRGMVLDFLRPARMDDELIVETLIETIGGASITMTQRVTRQDSEQKTILVTATVRLAILAGSRAKRIPPSIRAKLAEG